MSIEIKSPDYLQKLLNQQETLKNYKIWIYRTNTIVVDIEHDNITYGMDILIPAGSANNNLTISIVPRNHLSANTLQYLEKVIYSIIEFIYLNKMKILPSQIQIIY